MRKSRYYRVANLQLSKLQQTKKRVLYGRLVMFTCIVMVAIILPFSEENIRKASPVLGIAIIFILLWIKHGGGKPLPGN